MLCRARKFRDERNRSRGRLGEKEGEGERLAKRESFVSLSTKQPHLACSLSVTVPAAVLMAIVVVPAVATAISRQRSEAT